MVNDQNILTAEAPPVEEEPLYAIDARAYEASGRSFQYAIYSRLCGREYCPAREGEKEGDPLVLKTPSEYMKIIASQCSVEPDYLLPGTPITEAVFRLLLANNNKPMTLPDVQTGLTAAWASVIYLKNLSDDVLRRMLDEMNEYHIVRTAAPTKRKSRRRS